MYPLHVDVHIFMKRPVSDANIFTIAIPKRRITFSAKQPGGGGSLDGCSLLYRELL